VLRSCFGLGAFELVETRNRRPRRDTGQAFAHEHRVCADAVFAQHIGQMTLIRIDLGAVCLETHPSPQHEIRQPISRGAGKRRRRIESTANFRSVDAQQPDTPHSDDVDGVSVDDGTHQYRIRAPQRDCRCARMAQRDGSNCQRQAGDDEQEFHRDLL
jgi:hypothetical protein